MLVIRSTIAAILCSVTFAAHAMADTPTRIDVPAGELVRALETLSRQASVDLVFQPDQIKSFRTEGVSGTYSPQEAIRLLLKGTPLQLRTDASSGAMVIAVPAAGPKAAPVSPTGKRGSLPSPLHLAQSESANSGERESDVVPPVEEPSAVKGIPEILVEGSKILNMDIRRSEDDAQPYVIFDRAVIEGSGARNLEDFFRQRLPMNTAAAPPSQSQSGLGNMSQINLRGLGTNQTLILIDGHRAPGPVTATGSTAPGQPDLNGIPLEAVERIEVLPTTASGIYGGSATGGVVNIILRRDYSGAEVKVTYGNTISSDAGQRAVDLNSGFTLEDGKTNLLLAASWSDADQLQLGDRNLFVRGRNAILRNNPGSIFGVATPPLGGMPNIRSSNGSNLVLKAGNTPLNSPITYVPDRYGGVSTDQGGALAQNAGMYDLGLADSAQVGAGSRSGMIAAPEVKSATATVRRQFSPGVQAFLELNVASNVGEFSQGTGGTFSLPAAAATNPFLQAITVTVPTTGADSVSTIRNVSRRAVGGVIVKLSENWNAEADYTWAQSRFSTDNRPGLLNPTTTAAAVSSGALDVLHDMNAVPTDWSSFLVSTQTSLAVSTLKDATLRVEGPVFALPAGAARVAVLLEHRDEDFGQTMFSALSQTLFPARSQAVDSGYVEATVPLVARQQSWPLVQDLSLQLSGRQDRYSIDAATSSVPLSAGAPTTPISTSNKDLRSTNYTAGLRYEPIDDVEIRGSYGTGFLPPDVSQLITNPTPLSIPAGSLTDPRRGNQAVPAFMQYTGGNPALTPEESKSWSTGVIVRPRWIDGVRLSVDYTHIAKTNNITTILTQDLINNETVVPGAIVRGPVPANDPYGVGPITTIYRTARNVSQATIAAYDISLDYTRSTTRFGTFDFFALGTSQTHYRTQLVPGMSFVENVGVTSGNPLKWRGNAGLVWKRGGWTAGWTAQYYGSYIVSTTPTIVLNQGDRRVASQVYHDLYGSYRFDAREGASLLHGVQIQFGVKNVFDKAPPFDASNTYAYYSYFGDPSLARYSLAIRKSF